MEGGKIGGRLAGKELRPGVTGRVRQLSVEIRSREKPNAKLDTNAVASLKISGNTFVTSEKKSPKVHLVRTRREEGVSIAFFSKNDCIRIAEFQAYGTSCDNRSPDVLLA
jgi:hypothetical protein